MVIATPLRKGSVFEAGRVRMIWVVSLKDGRNYADLHKRCIPGLNTVLVVFEVNSLQRSRPAYARQHAEYSVVLGTRWSRISRRMGKVIGCLGLRSCSPWYFLMPRMRRCTSGDSRAVNGRSMLMCMDQKAER